MTLSLTTTKTDLHRALAVAKVAASADKSLPMLNALNLNVTDAGNLIVCGTDRYIAARVRLATENFSYGDDVTEGRLTFALQHVGLIQKWLTLVDKEVSVEVSHTTEHGLTVSAYGAPTLSGITPIEGTFPRIGKLFRSEEAVGDPDRTGAVVLAGRNVGKLGTIASYCKNHTPVFLRPGPKTTNETNDLLFRFSDHNGVLVDGLVMGIRYPSDDHLTLHGL